jgi:hypothetical protein
VVYISRNNGKDVSIMPVGMGLRNGRMPGCNTHEPAEYSMAQYLPLLSKNLTDNHTTRVHMFM